MKIIIETDRLFLRELEAADAAALSKVLSDEESMKYYPHPFSAAEVDRWIERNIRRYKENGFGLWAVVRKADKAFLGDCGITLQDIDGRLLPEIGFHIISDYRNMGYASEAAAACREYATGRLEFDRVYSYTHIDNQASRRVALKNGMKEIKKYFKDGTELVVYEYCVNKN